MAPGVFSSQHVSIHVQAGAELEYYPSLVIPFPESDFRQTLDVALVEGAKFGFLDMRAMGRVARSEYLAFRRASSRVMVRIGERPCYRDALELEPGKSDIVGMGVLEGQRYLASGYWHWDKPLKHPSIANPDVTLVTGRPAQGHLYLRAIAQDGTAMRAAVAGLLQKQRAAWGLSPLPSGRYLGGA